jgi:8-oxo-dGTP pyrophosphatase MutT (NUDIX family)
MSLDKSSDKVGELTDAGEHTLESNDGVASPADSGKSVHEITAFLRKRRPKLLWWRKWSRRSAVAMILRDGEQGAEVLMIKRAEREGDPWSGHMAFPGGVAEREDGHSLDTAIRETREEIGVELNECAELIGRLSDIGTPHRRGRKVMTVTVYVFETQAFPKPRINHEVAEVIWIPLAFLADEANRETMEWSKAGGSVTLPCYIYKGRRVWGLSLLMLDELLQQKGAGAKFNYRGRRISKLWNSGS